MKVYLVRHGESTLNKEGGRHQLPETPLSEHGFQQAAVVARRFASIPVDVILTSSYKRALQTALAIKDVKSVPLVKTDLLTERKLPTNFPGKLFDDPEITLTHQLIRDHFHESEWHYADEENFKDLIMRSKAVFDLIHSQKKENIVVVTHGYFLTVMVYHILFSDNVDPRLFQSFRESTTYSNTGLTLCEYVGKKWKLATWNDYAHLGEL